MDVAGLKKEDIGGGRSRQARAELLQCLTLKANATSNAPDATAYVPRSQMSVPVGSGLIDRTAPNRMERAPMTASSHSPRTIGPFASFRRRNAPTSSRAPVTNAHAAMNSMNQYVAASGKKKVSSPTAPPTKPSRKSEYQFAERPAPIVNTPSPSANSPNKETRKARVFSGARKAATPNTKATTPRAATIHQRRANSSYMANRRAELLWS